MAGGEASSRCKRERRRKGAKHPNILNLRAEMFMNAKSDFECNFFFVNAVGGGESQ